MRIDLLPLLLGGSLWSAAVPLCSGFHPPQRSHLVLSESPHTSSNNARDLASLTATGTAQDGDIGGAAQDPRSFLTQRGIQSFMYLLSTTRDLHTVQWLDALIQPITENKYRDANLASGANGDFDGSDKRIGSKLLNYHGLAALNTTMFPAWDSFFALLLEQPDVVVKIRTPKRRPRRRTFLRGAGRQTCPELEIEIEPARLCARMLSVREQIAREMSSDLLSIAKMGQLIFESYWENSKKRKDGTKATGGHASGSEDESSPCGFDHPSKLYITFDPLDDNALASSPLHKGNFDLLYNLITQNAIMLLLRSEDGVVVSEDPVLNHLSKTFLSDFYSRSLDAHFVGNQYYGRGDAFIEELMLGSPIIMSRNEDAGARDTTKYPAEASPRPLVVEPMRIAEQILLKRDKLALEWREIMDAVPSEHTNIRKRQLDRLTGRANAEPAKLADDVDEFQ